MYDCISTKEAHLILIDRDTWYIKENVNSWIVF